MKKWNAEYYENNNKESHVYLFTSLEIKKYLEKFFKDYELIVHEYQINFLESSIDIYVSYYQTLKSLEFIQKVNLKQKVVLKKKRFNKKLYTNNLNLSSLKKQIKNYYCYNNSFIGKKIINVLNVLKVLKLKYYSLKPLKTDNPSFLKKKKKILFYHYLKILNYKRYLMFILLKNKENNLQKRVQLLTYYKSYLNISEHKTMTHFSKNNFAEKLIESLSLFTKNRFNIYLTLKQINKNITFPKTRSQNLKRVLSKLRKFQKNNFFAEGVNILFNAVSHKNSAKLISDYIAFHLKFLKRHKFFLTFVTKTLTLLIDQKFSKIKGIKLKIKGRINNSSRSKSETIKIGGKTSLVTLSSEINHAQSTSYGSNGTFGVKAWVLF